MSQVTSEDKIRWLAERCVESGLSLKEAVHLFDALYISDALARTKGNATRAAEILDTPRTVFYQHQRRKQRQREERENDA